MGESPTFNLTVLGNAFVAAAVGELLDAVVEATIWGVEEGVAADVVVASVMLEVVEVVVLKTVPLGVVTTTTLGGVMAICGGSGLLEAVEAEG